MFRNQCKTLKINFVQTKLQVRKFYGANELLLDHFKYFLKLWGSILISFIFFFFFSWMVDVCKMFVYHLFKYLFFIVLKCMFSPITTQANCCDSDWFTTALWWRRRQHVPSNTDLWSPMIERLFINVLNSESHFIANQCLWLY